MKKQSIRSRTIAFFLCVMMCVSILPMQSFAASYDTSASQGYFTVISKDEYDLAPGATETEMVLNSSAGDDRKVVHVFEVDPKEETLQILPGYYGIDKLSEIPEGLYAAQVVQYADLKPYDPTAEDTKGMRTEEQQAVYEEQLAAQQAQQEALKAFEAQEKGKWTDKQLSQTVAYYEAMGHNVVGAMNTALAYDETSPYGYMVLEGKVLGSPLVHSGADTYLAINWDGSAELRSMSQPLTGDERTAISANFGWLVKDGKLASKTVERTSSDASRSMIGIKADGTIVFCQVDGRNAPVSTGLSNYEMGEMMLALGCVNAVNCDGGGSSTFISKRAGYDAGNIMRSVPSDGSERATINSVVLATTAISDGKLAKGIITSAYDYIAPGASMPVEIVGLDSSGAVAEISEDAVLEVTGGTMENGVFTAGSTTGEAALKLYYNEKLIGEKSFHVVHPASFGFTADSTVAPFGKNVALTVLASYGVDSWDVCIDGAYKLSLSDSEAAALEGNELIVPATSSKAGVDVIATYLPDTSVTDTLVVSFGKGSEILFDFEDGELGGFMGFDEAKQWSAENNVSNTLVGSKPLAGQCSDEVDGYTFLATTKNGGQVKNGNNALAWRVDNTTANFAQWTYNVLFNVGETIVLRDVANGKAATSLGMWLYIPEGFTSGTDFGPAFQSQLYTKNADGSYKHVQAHFTFTTTSGATKILNDCGEADIPESRWVYASVPLTNDYVCTPVATDVTSERAPSIIRTYIKPGEPTALTFYIDDITLDYSSAVEDRILPTIKDVTYATQDTATSLENGATIQGNDITFSANVSDNEQLKASSGLISVDGNPLKTSVSGKSMSASVKLAAGVHTVSFEIQDSLGNLAKVTKTFTIAGDAAVTLAGHNDSGKPAEYDSIYYVDVNVADLASVSELETTLKLQNANAWELEGIKTAPGFEATAKYNEVSELLTVAVERTDSAAALEEGPETLVSIPVRVWSWEAYSHFTGKEITPDTQYATGNCPIVSIECEVVKGLVNGTDPFGGEFSVATNLNDIENPWHKHDAKANDVEATCTANGVTGRTYCDGCGSVVEWGTVIPATGHSFDMIDGVIKCTCGELFTGTWTDGKDYANGQAVGGGWQGDYYYVGGVKVTGIYAVDGTYYNFGEDGKSQGVYTGLFNMNDGLYYAIGGNLVSDWQLIDDAWYYFQPAEGEDQYQAVTGKLRWRGINFEFGEDGKLTSGVWVTNEYGTRYYYASECYRASKGSNVNWQEIDGNTYGFGYDGFRYEGLAILKEGYVMPSILHEFTEEGVYIGQRYDTGFVEVKGKTYYCVAGVLTAAGVIEVEDGKYMYIGSDFMPKKNTTATVSASKTNGLVPAGTYAFDENGYMIFEYKIENGYYYLNGQPYGAGLILHDGEYYYAHSNGKLETNAYHITASGMNGLLGGKAGVYYFNADGTMRHEILVDGVYFENGQPYAKGWFRDTDGKVYYIRSYGKITTSPEYITANKMNDVFSGPAGVYYFNEDGSLRHEILVDGVYFENGQPFKKGWFEDENGDVYYIRSYGKITTGAYHVSTGYNGGAAGVYYFDENGVMRHEELYNGVYFENGQPFKKGWFEDENGDVYYIRSYGKITTGAYYASTGYNGGAAGVYYFDENGVMRHEELYNGVYFENGQPFKKGWFEDENGDVYYIRSYGKVTTGAYSISPGYNGGAAGVYYFDENGVMRHEEIYNGVYFENGQPYKKGLFEDESGDIYFIRSYGKVAVGTYVVAEEYTNGILPAGTYTFDESGKLISE